MCFLSFNVYLPKIYVSSPFLLPMPRNDDQQMSDLDWFSSRHRKPSACTLRLLHYPALPSDTVLEDEIDIRAGAHSDYGSITLLFQRPSQPGLEILTPESTWAPVPVIPEGYQTTTTFPPILVNIADLLSYWTNGYLKSTVHRVIFPKDARRGGEDRYSIAYFCHPSDDAELVPVPSQIVAERTIAEGEKVGYGGGTEGKKAMTAQEHLARRLGATYGFRMDEKAQVIDATA
jgi:isopenicillin N synthase-like dioxygenase